MQIDVFKMLRDRVLVPNLEKSIAPTVHLFLCGEIERLYEREIAAPKNPFPPPPPDCGAEEVIKALKVFDFAIGSMNLPNDVQANIRKELCDEIEALYAGALADAKRKLATGPAFIPALPSAPLANTPNAPQAPADAAPGAAQPRVALAPQASARIRPNVDFGLRIPSLRGSVLPNSVTTDGDANVANSSPGGNAESDASSQDNRDPQSHDPFWLMPKIKVVQVDPTSDRDPSSNSINEVNSVPEIPYDVLRDDPVRGHVWTYHFDLPARFATAKFAPAPNGACCSWEGEGSVIHEGMRLLVRQDGKYEVRFNITTPSIPVSIRMQLLLYPPAQGRTTRTLTLPPIVLIPSGPTTFPDDPEAGVDPTSYIVSVQGYSQVLKEAHIKPTDNLILVKRIGSARVGSGVRYQASH
jgi:hypothetical protein